MVNTTLADIAVSITQDGNGKLVRVTNGAPATCLSCSDWPYGRGHLRDIRYLLNSGFLPKPTDCKH